MNLDPPPQSHLWALLSAASLRGWAAAPGHPRGPAAHTGTSGCADAPPAVVLPPVSAQTQGQSQLRATQARAAGDPWLSPGHRDAGWLVKLQLRASETQLCGLEGHPFPDPTSCRARGALTVKGFSSRASSASASRFLT